MVAEQVTPSGGADDPVVQEGKLFAVISYLGILCVITLLTKKDNAFALFHAKQGLVLLIAAVFTPIFRTMGLATVPP